MATVSLDRERLAAALPDVTTDLRLAGLEGAVQVFRDRYGIPHVRARSAHDAFFGQGFVTAPGPAMAHGLRPPQSIWPLGRNGGPACPRSRQDDAPISDRAPASRTTTMRSMPKPGRCWMPMSGASMPSSTPHGRYPFEYDLVGCRPESWEPWDCLAVFKVRHIMTGVFEGKLWRARLANVLGAKEGCRAHSGLPAGPSDDRAAGRRLRWRRAQWAGGARGRPRIHRLAPRRPGGRQQQLGAGR